MVAEASFAAMPLQAQATPAAPATDDDTMPFILWPLPPRLRTLAEEHFKVANLNDLTYHDLVEHAASMAAEASGPEASPSA